MIPGEEKFGHAAAPPEPESAAGLGQRETGDQQRDRFAPAHRQRRVAPQKFQFFGGQFRDRLETGGLLRRLRGEGVGDEKGEGGHRPDSGESREKFERVPPGDAETADPAAVRGADPFRFGVDFRFGEKGGADSSS